MTVSIDLAPTPWLDLGRRSWLGPAAVAGGALALCATDVVLNPYKGEGLFCPFHELTGLWCPVCGSSRALYSLLHGDVRSAFARNPLFLVLVPILVWQWAAFLIDSLGGPHVPRLKATRSVIVVGLSVLVAFWVVRNLPFTALSAFRP